MDSIGKAINIGDLHRFITDLKVVGVSCDVVEFCLYTELQFIAKTTVLKFIPWTRFQQVEFGFSGEINDIAQRLEMRCLTSVQVLYWVSPCWCFASLLSSSSLWAWLNCMPSLLMLSQICSTSRIFSALLNDSISCLLMLTKVIRQSDGKINIVLKIVQIFDQNCFRWTDVFVAGFVLSMTQVVVFSHWSYH